MRAALDVWRQALVTTVRQDRPDLTARQLAVLLTVYLTAPPHTVRGLATTLNISKPAVTRALDRLGVFGFVKRKQDEADKRNVLVQRTVKGSVYLSEFGEIVHRAMRETASESTEAKE
ncbi:MarR family transcriptional regulator [Fodinicurvata sp. EGI_FJ10296]|uniref:MarR family transcriptional regulator n=1 Tax=Fodinicurvata sp. EGI_FJ10296 TaxID=3231908 RepID=UPI00345193CB